MNGLAAASALFPASAEAERIASLFWWMAGGAVLVWAGVIVLAVYAHALTLMRRPNAATRC